MTPAEQRKKEKEYLDKIRKYSREKLEKLKPIKKKNGID